MVNLLCQWAPLVPVAKFGAPTARSALAQVLLLRGEGRKVGCEQEVGEKKCPW